MPRGKENLSNLAMIILEILDGKGEEFLVGQSWVRGRCVSFSEDWVTNHTQAHTRAHTASQVLISANIFIVETQ